MKHTLLFFICACLLLTTMHAQGSDEDFDSELPVRGLAIAAPSVDGMNTFLKFIEEELAPAHFNLLILRVDWNYAYESHPELRDPNPLTKADVKKIVATCKKYGIRLAPQINLLGHQSWAKTTHALLRVYPEFDETPHIDTENYTGWPNPDGLYCKSYCPLHPDVHKVVFALVDELMDVFETDLFHAGMDEVFYIGEDQCPRCSGHDKAELYAGEVTKIQNHLSQTGKRLMIWGDRLIDGKTTGIGTWEASMNNTYRAIDMIPKDVFICDWHYDRPDLTAVYFAMKGFDVATCPYRKPDIALQQLKDMIHFRQNSTKAMANHFQGIIATVWSGADSFLKSYYDPQTYTGTESEAITIKKLMEEYKKLKLNPSEKVARSFIQRTPDPDSIHWVGDSNHFSWQAGYIMFAMEKMWKYTGDSIYYNYIKRYVDQQVDEDGNVSNFINNALDNFLPGYAIVFMYENTGLEKYRKAATTIRNGFNNYPRASNGLFWHTTNPWGREQVWVDGVFMGQLFLARYGKSIGDSDNAFKEVAYQITKMADVAQKSNGLLLHGWDETKQAAWADKKTGLSPEVWSEGVGWYAVLMADVFDFLPENDLEKDRLLTIMKNLCAGIKASQDTSTGLWCQVVDKCEKSGNWNETSGSAMFVYLLQKAINKGYISKAEYQPVADKGYNGLLTKMRKNKEGLIDLIDCSSIGVMNSFEQYVSQPKEVNTFAAFGSYIIGTSIHEYGF